MSGRELASLLTNTGYAITPLPGRKRVALCRTGPASMTPIAYFYDADEANRFMDWMVAVSKIVHISGEERPND